MSYGPIKTAIQNLLYKVAIDRRRAQTEGDAEMQIVIERALLEIVEKELERIEGMF